jgi:hypothetical protein
VGRPKDIKLSRNGNILDASHGKCVSIYAGRLKSENHTYNLAYMAALASFASALALNQNLALSLALIFDRSIIVNKNSGNLKYLRLIPRFHSPFRESFVSK